LAAEASLAALNDAGLTPADVDGMIVFTLEDNEEADLMQTLGIPGLSWVARIGQGGGGGAAGTVFHAAAAIASGACETVLIYRAFNERSGRRFGRPQPAADGERGWNGTGFGNIIWASPMAS
jgi:acetyl-CoA acetyltransferase